MAADCIESAYNLPQTRPATMYQLCTSVNYPLREAKIDSTDLVTQSHCPEDRGRCKANGVFTRHREQGNHVYNLQLHTQWPVLI